MAATAIVAAVARAVSVLIMGYLPEIGSSKPTNKVAECSQNRAERRLNDCAGIPPRLAGEAGRR